MLATGFGAALCFWLMHRALIDDAYITLTYARTLAEHGEWGLLPGVEANTATSPLNVLLLGGITVVAGDPVGALGVLYVGNALALALALRGLGRAMGLGLRPAVIGTPLLLLNPLLASTLGLEATLVVTTIVFATWAAVSGNAGWFGLTAGVLLLLRLDLALVVAAVVLLTPRLWPHIRLAAAVAGTLLFPWVMFSWSALGSAIPDTLLIKQDSNRGGFATGLVDRFLEPYTWAVTAGLLMAAVGLVALVLWPAWRWRLDDHAFVIPALAGGGFAHYLGIWALDVPAFFWYYAPGLACLTVCGVLAMATLIRDLELERRPRVMAALGAPLAVPALIPWVVTAAYGVPFHAALVHGNAATPGEYATIGRQLPELTGGAPVRSAGEVGTLVYFCRCLIVDRFTDRSLLRQAIEERIADNWLYRINYAWLDADHLRPIDAEYALFREPGSDPKPPEWPATTPQDYNRPPGHFVLRPLGRATTSPERVR